MTALRGYHLSPPGRIHASINTDTGTTANTLDYILHTNRTTTWTPLTTAKLNSNPPQTLPT